MKYKNVVAAAQQSSPFPFPSIVAVYSEHFAASAHAVTRQQVLLVSSSTSMQKPVAHTSAATSLMARHVTAPCALL
jgi:hypothetical protein